eukprot:TRINITY_DN3352_c0_g1_i3.p1 TRINITY_DN3352_c0_g1~~TRINITY_DN3352_c0_g1_i3.p1  ORF type:complete len:158 (-),score=11.86 TRINITY_DN3352_c0_g1_i3:132-605(-)
MYALKKVFTLGNYLCAYVISYMINDKELNISPEDMQDSLDYLEVFFNNFTPVEIRELERSYGFVWSIVSPFYKLTESTIKVVHDFGCFALANLCYFDLNRKHVIDEELLDDVLSLQWSKSERARGYSMIILKCFKTYTCPSLKSIIKSYQRNLALNQ